MPNRKQYRKNIYMYKAPLTKKDMVDKWAQEITQEYEPWDIEKSKRRRRTY